MANLQSVRQGRCHISFVREMGFHLQIKTFLIECSLVAEYAIMSGEPSQHAVTLKPYVTSQEIKTSMLRYATLTGSTKFIQFLHTHPFFFQLSRLSPANVTVVLNYLKFEYNKNIMR